jgi:DNA invertase Pin-like site-specific DNA recombinase
MMMTIPMPLRCAIYTRKSTEHNLDLAFNSLDAQREACEAYIKSQGDRSAIDEDWYLGMGEYLQSFAPQDNC